jgi:hypothetical protein
MKMKVKTNAFRMKDKETKSKAPPNCHVEVIQLRRLTAVIMGLHR